MAALPLVERRIRKRLALNARRFRQRARLPIQEVAARAGMHWRHLQKIEAGEVNATLRTLARLAEVLDVEPHELLI